MCTNGGWLQDEIERSFLVLVLCVFYFYVYICHMPVFGEDSDILFPELDADINHFNDLYPDIEASICSEYYDTEKLKTFRTTNSDFALFSFNTRSLFRHYDELHALMSFFAFILMYCLFPSHI